MPHATDTFVFVKWTVWSLFSDWRVGCGCSFTTFILVSSVPCTWVPGYLGTWVPGYLGTWVPGYLGTWVPGYLGTWVPGYLGTWVPGYLGMACTISLECTIQKLYRSDFCIVKSIQFVYDLVYTGIVHKLYRSDYKKSWDCTSNSQIYTISIQLYVQLTIVYTMSV